MCDEPCTVKKSVAIAVGGHMEKIMVPIKQTHTMLNLQSNMVHTKILLQLILHVRPGCVSGVLRGGVPLTVVDSAMGIQPAASALPVAERAARLLAHHIA